MNHSPDGPPDFQYGWEGGCASGAMGRAGMFYHDTKVVGFRKDFEYAENHPDYEVGWQMGFWYCVRIAERQDGIGDGKSQGIW